MFLYILLLFGRRMTTSSDSSLPSCVICWCWRPRQRRKQRKHTGLSLTALNILISFSKLHREHWMKALCTVQPMTQDTKHAWRFCVSQYVNVRPHMCIWWLCVLLECCCRAKRLARLNLKLICIEKHTEVLLPLSTLTWIHVLHWKITCSDLHVNPPSGRAVCVHQAAVSERAAHRNSRLQCREKNTSGQTEMFLWSLVGCFTF